MTNSVVRVLAIPDHLLACGYSTLDTKSADEEYPFFDIKSKFRIGHWCFFFLLSRFSSFFPRGGGEGVFLGFVSAEGGRNICTCVLRVE